MMQNLVLVAAMLLMVGRPAGAQTTFVDAQNWWKPVGESLFGHIHVGVALPSDHRVSGVVNLSVQVEVFQLVGEIIRVGCGLAGVDGMNINLAQPVNLGVGEEAQFSYNLSVNSSLAVDDGWKPLSVNVTLQLPNGDKMWVELARPVYLVNGQPVSNAKAGPYESTVWVSRPGSGNIHGYAGVKLPFNGFPPTSGVGPWAPLVTFNAKNNTTPRAKFASVDPHMHIGDQGTVILDVPANLEAQATLPDVYSYPLAVGAHKLFMRSSDEGAFPDAMAGVLVVPFTKQ